MNAIATPKKLMLTVLESLPVGLLDARARDLHGMLPGPTLVHIPGRREAPLFVSVLLHGNEVSGLYAVQRVLARFRNRELPRALSLLIGNVEAARAGVRRLDHQADFNRVWPGADDSGRDEHRFAAEVMEVMRERGAFASVDIHNNTGISPHYACIRRLDPPFLHLAALFSRTVVYFARPRGTQTGAFSTLCPSVAVECGKSGEDAGIAHAAEYLEACLHLSGLPEHPVPRHDLDLFHTVAVVKVPEDVEFSFGTARVPLTFPTDIDRMNFRELQEGTLFATISDGRQFLDVRDEGSNDVFERYFEVRRGRIVTRRPVMPSMLTLDPRAIRQDCLCYLMERM